MRFSLFYTDPRIHLRSRFRPGALVATLWNPPKNWPLRTGGASFRILLRLRSSKTASPDKRGRHWGGSGSFWGPSQRVNHLQCSHTGFEKPHETALELVYRAENRCKSIGARAGGLFQAFLGPIWARKCTKT